MEAKKMIAGLKFPPQIHHATGRFLISEGAQNVKESVYLILMTQKSERFTRPEFGSLVMTYPFTEPSSTRKHMMEREIRETIQSQEPRIADVEVEISFEPETQKLFISVDYTLKEGGMEHVDLSV